MTTNPMHGWPLRSPEKSGRGSLDTAANRKAEKYSRKEILGRILW